MQIYKLEKILSHQDYRPTACELEDFSLDSLTGRKAIKFLIFIKEHCLMGIKGTIRRSIDSNFIHTNVDIDLILTEELANGDMNKPEEIFHIIEHFCLGNKRLYLFGRDDSVRNGWLTVGPALTRSNFDKNIYKLILSNANDHHSFDFESRYNERIDILRPKSPPFKNKQQQNPTVEPINKKDRC